jgi:hypothetical protein
MEFKGHYKDITETKETTGGMKGVKASNDSASPSHHFFAEEFALHLTGGETVITIIWHPLGGVIDVDGGGGWSQRLQSRRWRSISVDGVVLTCLLFFNRVVDDDDVAITGWPKKTVIEVTEESHGEILIP